MDENVPGTVTISWTPSPDEKRDDRLHYMVTKRDSSKRTWHTVADRIFNNKFTACNIMPGREYQFRVYAKNDMGSSAPSESPKWLIVAKKGILFYFFIFPGLCVKECFNSTWRLNISFIWISIIMVRKHCLQSLVPYITKNHVTLDYRHGHLHINNLNKTVAYFLNYICTKMKGQYRQNWKMEQRFYYRKYKGNQAWKLFWKKKKLIQCLTV